MHDAGCLGLVHWVDPEGWYGEGGGRRVQDGEHMYKKKKKKKILASLVFLVAHRLFISVFGLCLVAACGPLLLRWAGFSSWGAQA